MKYIGQRRQHVREQCVKTKLSIQTPEYFLITHPATITDLADLGVVKAVRCLVASPHTAVTKYLVTSGKAAAGKSQKEPPDTSEENVARIISHGMLRTRVGATALPPSFETLDSP